MPKEPGANNKLYFMRYIFSICILFFSVITFAQAGRSEKSGDIVKIIEKSTRAPRRMVEKNITAFFSLKLILSNNNKLDTILATKYAPLEIAPVLCDKAKYENVKWDSLFKRNTRKGDIVLIPIAIYSGDAQNTMFYEYTLDDLFNFSGRANNLFNCLMMQTIVVKYGAIMK